MSVAELVDELEWLAPPPTLQSPVLTCALNPLADDLDTVTDDDCERETLQEIRVQADGVSGLALSSGSTLSSDDSTVRVSSLRMAGRSLCAPPSLFSLSLSCWLSCVISSLISAILRPICFLTFSRNSALVTRFATLADSRLALLHACDASRAAVAALSAAMRAALSLASSGFFFVFCAVGVVGAKPGTGQSIYSFT